jgi:sugar transferase (PEP-CTERM/EpsH1 system associated)
MKPALLFLCHRIPYPPNKGDKIRSFHLFKYLSARYRIFLGAFIDDPGDWKHVDRLHEWCEEKFLLELNAFRAKLSSLRGLFGGKPLTLPYYHHRKMAAWVNKTMEREGIRDVLIYSSAMAQYVAGPEFSRARRVVDLVDVDSDKWRQYASRARLPMNWVYRREADRLLDYEREIGSIFDGTLLVSEEEAELFRRLAPEVADRVHGLRNGVDLEAFDAHRDYPNPYAMDRQHLVFTGAMDYWPNVDAVVWFVEEVFLNLRQHLPNLEFHIVGSRPTERVRALGALPGVEVTGSVEKIQPYIRHAQVVVVPMRIARGIQNKVLEAMAMSRPVVVSPMGLEGIDARDGKEVLVAESAADFEKQVRRVLDGEVSAQALGNAARNKVMRDFAWETALPLLDRWFDGGKSATTGR